MRFLAIETASEACSVALFEGVTFNGSQVIAHDHRVLGRGHAERLVPMIAALPDKGRADRIFVSLGPGSFTGVRVGLAAARALGVAWNAPVQGYETLRLIHAIAAHPAPRPVTVCVNGGQGEWFVQNFAADGEAQDRVRSLTPEQVKTAGVHPVIAGNRAEECAALFADDAGEDPKALPILPDARLSNQLRDAHFTDDLSPLYGRAPDATPQKLARAS
ncbi:MAG: tRNA (adenosine(37)-N6)-threonylcarbamoyltransferase complex dimerization subunit type 1 TsaB [Pseudomonadota bacterium]